MKDSVVLIILDGFGLSPIEEGNAVLSASLPFISILLGSYPKVTLSASGEEVGLPFGEMGNSEVGHLNLGTGRVVLQDLPRINKAIEEGSFFENEVLKESLNYARKNNSAVHLIGLVSAGGVHSHIEHLFALLDFFNKNNFKNVYIHMITDGRDTPPKVAGDYLKKLEKKINTIGFGKISSISGRYFAMDRDKRWERTEKAYKAIARGEGDEADTAYEAIENAYNRQETDEFITPTVIKKTKHIENKDVVIFFNFRADRARQLWQMLRDDISLKNCFFASFTSYGYEPSALSKVAFFPEEIKNQLGRVLEENGLKQLHIAETEKYAHVTYFFNGGLRTPFKNETQILIPSPKVSTYDLKPEMSAEEITQKFLKEISKYDFAVINFANPDMVGHTGNFQATIKALETVDQCLAKIIPFCAKINKKVIITADHGNAETMIDIDTKNPYKEHTTNPVFLILIDEERKESQSAFNKNDFISLSSMPPVGILADVAPTILEIMGLDKPKEMSGMSLLPQLR